MKLEIAAGYSRTPDYDIYLDVNPNCNPDVVSDALKLPFKDSTMDVVRCVDILEHLSYTVSLQALTEWARVMKTGAKIYIQVPDTKMAVEDWLAGKDRKGYRPQVVPEFAHLPSVVSLAWRLLGGHDTTNHVEVGDDWKWNAHYSLWTEESLRWYLEKVGLQIDSLEVNFHPNLCCWAKK